MSEQDMRTIDRFFSKPLHRRKVTLNEAYEVNAAWSKLCESRDPDAIRIEWATNDINWLLLNEYNCDKDALTPAQKKEVLDRLRMIDSKFEGITYEKLALAIDFVAQLHNVTLGEALP